MRAEVMTLGTPNPRQREFLACEKKYVAFGGARGGGKSWAVRCKAKLLALRYAGIRILLVRRSLAELEANHLAFLRQELADVAEYRAGERQFRFCNGSVLQFGYCGCDRDLDRYQGAEYDVIFLDEATANMDKASSQQILSQLLQTDGLTVISIEHKVSPEILPLYDTILELKDKRLVERA